MSIELVLGVVFFGTTLAALAVVIWIAWDNRRNPDAGT
jgi:hypothetical protein